MSAKVFWLTGLSGSGKTTLSEAVRDRLTSLGKSVRIIDGDDVRAIYKVQKGFSFEDVMENNMFILELIKAHQTNYDVILVPVIAPYEKIRKIVREKLGDIFYLIYCNANLEVVKSRDTKGLYLQASEGRIKNLIGYSEGFPYEIPTDCDLEIETINNSVVGQELCVNKLLSYILKAL